MEEMELDKYDYYGASVETPQTRVEDAGTGKPIVLRRFQFKYPPQQRGVPTKDQLLTPGFIKYLENMLWADAMEMIIEPKLHYQKGGFSTFCTCQVKKGNLIRSEDMERLRPVQDILQGKVDKKT